MRSCHSPYHHFIPSPLTLSPLTPSPLTPSPLLPSPFTLSPLHPLPLTPPPSLHRHFISSPFSPSPLLLLTTSPFHLIAPPPPHTHSLTGGSGVCCGVLSPLREGPDQCSQEENQHHPHHRGRQTPRMLIGELPVTPSCTPSYHHYIKKAGVCMKHV